MICREIDKGAFDGRRAWIEIEIADKKSVVRSCMSEMQMTAPVIRDSNHRLCAFTTHKFDLVFDIEDGLSIFLVRSVPNLALYCAWEPLIPISAYVGELYSFAAVSTHGAWSFEIFLAPTLLAAMQAIGPVVGIQ